MCREPIEFVKVGELELALSKSVYRPSHDTFLLATAVTEIARSTPRSICPPLIEIGTGTGYVALNALKYMPYYTILTDISPCAVVASWLSAKRNSLDWCIDVVQCESASCLRSSIAELVFFNPPYLPEEKVHDFYDLALCGGSNGIEVWQSFYDDALRVCRKPCFVVFVFSSLQNLESMFSHVLDTCSSIEILDCQYFFFESVCTAIARCDQ